MLAGTTYQGRARRALLHKQHSTYWVGLGRQTPWPAEPTIPSIDPSATAIEEAFLYIKATVVSLCVPVQTGGNITVNGQAYAFVADADAIAQGARFLCLQFIADPNVMPANSFRQHGVFCVLVPAAGHENDSWLIPSNVQSIGILERISNHAVWSVNPGETRYIVVPTEFK